MLYFNTSCCWYLKYKNVSALKRAGACIFRCFCGLTKHLTSGLVRELDVAHGTSRNLSNLRVCPQQRVVPGSVAAVSIAAAILSLLGNQRACSAPKWGEFVLLLTFQPLSQVGRCLVWWRRVEPCLKWGVSV